MTQNQILQVRVHLTGKLKDKFLKIKENKGLENNTDVLRLIIGEYYHSLFRENRGEEAS